MNSANRLLTLLQNLLTNKTALKKQSQLVNLSSILEMFGGDNTYIKEFADAAIISFNEFSENYTRHLLDRNETDFRKAGHKIKPVAKMLGIDLLIDEYEHEKHQFGNNKSDAELKESANKMNNICDRILSELAEISASN